MTVKRVSAVFIAAGIATGLGVASMLGLSALHVPVTVDGVDGLTALLPVMAFAASVAAQTALAGRHPAVTALMTGLAVAVVMALTFVVLGGLGSGEPFRGPALAIALFATATPWILLVLQSVAAAVVAARWRGATRTSTDGTTTR